MPNNLVESYSTFRKAYEKLKEFIDTDNGSEKDNVCIWFPFILKCISIAIFSL